MPFDDLDQPLAERRERRVHARLPKRYRDILPDPPAALPPPSQPLPPFSNEEPVPLPSPVTVVAKVRKFLNSARNNFGLFRRYHANRFPEHDPNENLTPDDLMETSPNSPFNHADNPYGPYPNQTSFLLGEWQWNDGVKKTISSFKNLLKIIGHPSFRSEDVAGTNWKRIDAQLSEDPQGNHSNGEGDEDAWENELDDGDWIETPIQIKVPLHSRTLHPGKEAFKVGMLHHRKLVSVIREKILQPSSHPHFHLEPYELYWQPNEHCKPVRVHGELYTSDAFIETHRSIQDSPGEPGCDLPRVVVGLMFASDSTHLTAFSDAKLWPVYLTIGNESKDRRSKPSCQAFSHVAYFEKVCLWLHAQGQSCHLFHSSPMPSRLLQRNAWEKDLMTISWHTVIEKLFRLSGTFSLMKSS
jgi:hypothetical protein